MLADIRSENRLDAVLNVLCTDGPSTFMHIEKAINFPWEEGDVNIKNMDGQIVYRGPREFTDYMGTYISMGLVRIDYRSAMCSHCKKIQKTLAAEITPLGKAYLNRN